MWQQNIRQFTPKLDQHPSARRWFVTPITGGESLVAPCDVLYLLADLAQAVQVSLHDLWLPHIAGRGAMHHHVDGIIRVP